MTNTGRTGRDACAKPKHEDGGLTQSKPAQSNIYDQNIFEFPHAAFLTNTGLIGIFQDSL